MTAKFDRYAPQMIADLVHDFGLADFQAAGFPGNFGAESAGLTDIVEDGAIAKGWAGGTGWAQWTGLTDQPGTSRDGRRKQFEDWLKRKGFSADSYEGNYSFLFRELKGGEGRRVLPKLRQAKNVEDAADIVCREYERPAKNNYGPRREWARRALEGYRAKRPAPTIWPTDVKVEPMFPTPTPTPPLNPPVPKPWYTSKTIIGAIIAIVTPILAKAIPFFGLIPDAVVEQTVEQFLLVVGPMIGGLLAGFGRLAVTAPIASTQAAVVVEKRYEAALNEPSPSQAVPVETWREEPVAAPPARPDYDLDSVPFSVLVEWLPRIRHMLNTLDGALHQTPQLPAPERRD